MIADQAIFKCKPNCVIIHLYRFFSLKFPFIHLTIRLGKLDNRDRNDKPTDEPRGNPPAHPGILVLIQLLPTVYDETWAVSVHNFIHIKIN